MSWLASLLSSVSFIMSATCSLLSSIWSSTSSFRSRSNQFCLLRARFSSYSSCNLLTFVNLKWKLKRKLWNGLKQHSDNDRQSLCATKWLRLWHRDCSLWSLWFEFQASFWYSLTNLLYIKLSSNPVINNAFGTRCPLVNGKCIFNLVSSTKIKYCGFKIEFKAYPEYLSSTVKLLL